MQFYGVAGRDGLSAIESFIDSTGVDGFEHIVDETGEVWTDFEIASQPAFIFLNQDGETDRRLGAMGESGITNALEDLIAN